MKRILNTFWAPPAGGHSYDYQLSEENVLKYFESIRRDDGFIGFLPATRGKVLHLCHLWNTDDDLQYEFEDMNVGQFRKMFAMFPGEETKRLPNPKAYVTFYNNRDNAIKMYNQLPGLMSYCFLVHSERKR